MNFKSLIALGLGVATLGLSLPAFAEKATILSTDQEIVVTGDKNHTSQSSRTKASSYDRGNRDSAGIDASTKQKADILGDKNDTHQRSTTNIRETRVRNK
jgi:hypothetical protein